MESTLPETNIAHENPIFPGKYHQNGGFSMAMLVYRRVGPFFFSWLRWCSNQMAPAKSMSMASWTVPGIPGFLRGWTWMFDMHHGTG